MFAYLFCIVTGTSVGAKDLPWCDCKILDKFYEKNVLWAHIECRWFYYLIVLFCCLFDDVSYWFECDICMQLNYLFAYSLHNFLLQTFWWGSAATPSRKIQVHVAATTNQTVSRRTLGAMCKVSCARQIIPSALRSNEVIKIRVFMAV